MASTAPQEERYERTKTKHNGRTSCNHITTYILSISGRMSVAGTSGGGMKTFAMVSLFIMGLLAVLTVATILLMRAG